MDSAPNNSAFQKLQTKAASGCSGSRRAQAEVRLATLRGLAAATGKPLPPGVQ